MPYYYSTVSSVSTSLLSNPPYSVWECYGNTGIKCQSIVQETSSTFQSTYVFRCKLKVVKYIFFVFSVMYSMFGSKTNAAKNGHYRLYETSPSRRKLNLEKSEDEEFVVSEWKLAIAGLFLSLIVIASKLYYLNRKWFLCYVVFFVLAIVVVLRRLYKREGVCR